MQYQVRPTLQTPPNIKTQSENWRPKILSNCRRKNVIYFLGCTRCQKQYVGKSEWSFYFRSYNYRLRIKSMDQIYGSEQSNCSVSWGCRIHWLHLCGRVRHPPNECPRYDTKQSDDEVPLMLGLWGIRSTPSLPLLPGPFWPGVGAPERALSMG